MNQRLDALELAIALYKAPREIERVRARPLPDGMATLFRCAGGDGPTLASCAQATAAREHDLVEAARFYVQHVLLADDDNPYRMLGLRNGADATAIKEHHRLLIKYLHPDRSDGSWLDVYAERINRAWTALRTPERRAEVDRYLAAGGAQQGPMADFVVPTFARAPMPPPPTAPVRAGRWIAASVVAVVALMGGALYFDSQVPQTTESDSGWASSATAAVKEAAEERRAAETEPAATDVPDEASVGEAVLLVSESATAAPETTLPEEPPAEETEEPEPRATTVKQHARRPRGAAGGADGEEEEDEDEEDDDDVDLPGFDDKGYVEDDFGDEEDDGEPEEEAEDDDASDDDSEDSAVTSAVAAVAVPVPSPAPPAPPTPPKPQSPSPEDVDLVLQDFRSAYARGDLDQFLHLFAKDAKNRHGGLEAIASDYRTFFADSSIRAIRFRDVRLYQDGPLTIATADFVARITPRTSFDAVEVEGEIQFDLRRDANRVLIARMLHREN